jgi:iron complex outermembrane receptor protein
LKLREVGVTAGYWSKLSLNTIVLISNTATVPIWQCLYNTFRPQPYSNLKWEETTTVNAGLDYGFFNNRITGAVDLYKRTTKDLLLYAKPIFLWVL